MLSEVNCNVFRSPGPMQNAPYTRQSLGSRAAEQPAEPAGAATGWIPPGMWAHCSTLGACNNAFVTRKSRTNRDLRDPSHYSRTTSAFASADLGHFRGQYPSVNFKGVDELKQIVQPRAQPAPLVMCKEPLAPNSVKIDAASKQEEYYREASHDTATQGRSGCSPPRELESTGAASLGKDRALRFSYLLKSAPDPPTACPPYSSLPIWG